MFGIKNPKNPEAEMGFFDHVEVLRWHIIRSAIAIGVCASIVGIYYDFVFDKIILGIQSRNFPTYRALCWLSRTPLVEWLHKTVNATNNMCVDQDMHIPLQNTEMFGQITLLFQYSLIIGLIAAFPYVIWELWRFVAPALKPEDQKKVSRAIMASSAFFFLGVAFCYFIIIPFSVNFAVNFSLSPTIKNNFTIDNYIDFFTVMVLAMGAIFEMPMIVYFLSKVGILKPKIMRTGRRYAILIILIAAGVITPSPDAFTQCLVAIPIYVLYELSIFIAARNARQNERRANAKN